MNERMLLFFLCSLILFFSMFCFYPNLVNRARELSSLDSLSEVIEHIVWKSKHQNIHFLMEMCIFIGCVIVIPYFHIGKTYRDAVEGKLVGYGLFPLLSYCIGMYFDLGAGFTDGTVVVRSIAQQQKQIQALYTDSRQDILTFSKPFSVFHACLLTNILALYFEDNFQIIKILIFGSYSAALSIYWPISSKFTAQILKISDLKLAITTFDVGALTRWLSPHEFFSLFIVVIIGFLVFESTFSVCRKFSPHSFTFGESIIMSNVMSICFLRLVDLSRNAHLLVADDVSMIEAFIELMVLSTVFFGVTCYLIFVKWTRRRYNTITNYVAYAVAYYSVVLTFVTQRVLLPEETTNLVQFDVKHPVLWLLEFIFLKDIYHVYYLVYWLACIFIIFIVMSFSREIQVPVKPPPKVVSSGDPKTYRHNSTAPTNEKSEISKSVETKTHRDLILLFGDRIRVPKIIYRKFFHIMAVVMFVPCTIQKPLFMCLSYAVAVCLFLLIESFRVQFITEHDNNRLAKALHFYIKQFTDSRDSGTFILTHIYLLIGCMIPTCVEIFSHETTINYHRTLSGVLILGIGDTMASIVGFNFGKTKWNYPANTRKSIEGTIASFISVCAIAFLVVPTPSSSKLEILSYIFCAFSASVLEAYTVQIDNLILPIFFYTLLCAFSTVYTIKSKLLVPIWRSGWF
ncbi:hypothetical protein C9374_012158 [Naegleria lovaniensis]|uniref:dolichol kinase n=1 Tax=Naegleria lovaniensis TaxID=51637 RepID=A0AA88GDA6_NAELO|nr:uncharacterized protein C9374_012158 [Naegleria lovaniensis]KAG2373419.1 hypothetical protein C9374_012158 [Naegleria lovaniensis]